MPRVKRASLPLVHVGNCIPWLRSMRAGSVDVMIADPPYSDETHDKSRRAPSKGVRNPSSGAAERKTPLARDLGFKPLTQKLADEFAGECARLVKRWTLVFCDDRSIGGWRWTLERAGLEVVRTCPWIKPNSSPQFTGDRPGAGWEAIVVAHATRSRGRPMQKHWNGGGHRGVFVHNVPRGEERLHTTEKPIELLLELVELFSDRDELVVDPFLGAGTTGAACIRLGRRFAGAELDRKVARDARERLAAEREGHSLRDARAGQLSLLGAVG